MLDLLIDDSYNESVPSVLFWQYQKNLQGAGTYSRIENREYGIQGLLRNFRC